MPTRRPAARPLSLALCAAVGTCTGGGAGAAPGGAPFGSWASPVAAPDLAQAAIAMSDVRVDGDALVWRESRPAEGGRQVLVRREADGRTRVLTPEGFGVRTRVQEYGGSSHWAVPVGVVFAMFADHSLFLRRVDAAPDASTPTGYQYADCVADTAR
ncbi:MAG: hypothetical protein ACK52N_12545, partial [Lysobacteraceae bacterium]